MILYEDSRGPTTRFPLHDLVVKSAADLLQSGVDIHELFRRVVAVPRNGVNKVEVFLLENNLEDLLSSIDGQLDATLLGKALAKRLDARDILLDEIARSRQLRAALRTSHAGFDWVSRFVASIVETDSPPP